MANTLKELGQTLTTIATQTLYTCPALTTALALDLTICNTDTSAHTYTIWKDSDGTTASDATAMFSAVSIAASTTHHVSIKWSLEATGTIKVAADADNHVNISITGLEQT